MTFFARLFVVFALCANIFCTRCEKYSSKLDIFRSFVCIFATEPYSWFIILKQKNSPLYALGESKKHPAVYIVCHCITKTKSR